MQAEQGIQQLKEKVDTQIVIPNDRLLTVADEKTSMLNAFKHGRRDPAAGRAGHHRPHHHAGSHQHRLRRRSHDHVRRRLRLDGHRLRFRRRPRVSAAARAAISSPLLETSIEGARGILLNISGGSDLGLLEVNDAAEVIHSVAHPDANIIFGAVIDDAMGDEVRVTVIAAGFDRYEERPKATTLSTDSGGGGSTTQSREVADIFGEDDDDLGLGDDDDDFDVPSFLK